MKIPFILLSSAFILLFALKALAQMPYDVGDWTSYKDFRYARSVDAGTHEVFVATSGGILEYQLFRNKWLEPMVVGYGMSEAVTLDDPMLLFFDEQTGYLWVATKTQLLQYDVTADRWRVINRNLWGPTERVVNIGVGANDIYVETIPAQVFGNIFLGESPLPATDQWLTYVTRYKGSRSIGSLLMDLGQTFPDGMRWRGLRARVPLRSDQLYGSIGTPPANFPTVLLPSGWIWNSDGNIMDPYLRPATLTDWIVDTFGHFWATYWGAGVLIDDLRGGRAEFYSAGPAGNDVRAIRVEHDHVWLGGMNTGERKGVTRATSDLSQWEFFETRGNSRLRSTAVFDITDWNEDTWFATDEGLVAYKNREQSWKLYGLSEHLQSEHITALAATDSELWIGSSDGLAVMSLPNRDIFRINNSGPLISEVTRLAFCKDTLYVATRLGLYRGSAKDRRFVFASFDPVMSSTGIADISVIASEIWVATANGVLVYDQTDGKAKSFQLSWTGGLVPTAVYASSRFVWVGTPNGLYRYKRDGGEWISYTTKDGLIDNRVQVIRGYGDDLLIGTPEGLTRFYWNRPNQSR